jgi:class 3 adenylate cyclase
MPIPRRWSIAFATGSALTLLAVYAYSTESAPTGPFAPGLVNAFGAANLLLVCVFLAMLASVYVTKVESAEEALEDEHSRSEALLHNVLPSTIVDRLKLSTNPIADRFEAASILFADLVGFTEMSSTMTPVHVVEMLDEVFTRLDRLTQRYQGEKIKTIGDAYMVAAGIPSPRADHAEVLARLALDMHAAVAEYNAEAGTTLALRIGLHSGAVVAGVIGKTRFLYDLWGDTVNTASRMESHGVAGEVQLTEATAALLESTFVVEERGIIEVKGKGRMRTFFLRSKKPAAA